MTEVTGDTGGQVHGEGGRSGGGWLLCPLVVGMHDSPVLLIPPDRPLWHFCDMLQINHPPQPPLQSLISHPLPIGFQLAG